MTEQVSEIVPCISQENMKIALNKCRIVLKPLMQEAAELSLTVSGKLKDVIGQVETTHRIKFYRQQ